MIRSELVTLLADALPGGPPPESPTRLRELEAEADRRGWDPLLERAIASVHGQTIAGSEHPPVVAGIRRRSLVRWDARTTTWDGAHVASGAPAMIRTLRPAPARDPAIRRAFVRQMRALDGLVKDLVIVDGVECAAWAPLPGPAFQPSLTTPEVDAAALARLTVTGLGALVQWEAAGLGCPTPDPRELRDGGDHLAFVCLTPSAAGHAGTAVAELATAILAWWDDGPEGPVSDVVRMLAWAPSQSASDAAAQLRRALVQDLTGRRHGLVIRARQVNAAGRRDRFIDLLDRLDAASPPPDGRGALGVDLEGRTVVVESDGEEVVLLCGAVEPDLVYEPEGGLIPSRARRMLQLRASAAPNPRLHAEVGGDPAFVEAICRWTAAAQELRLMRKLASIPP